MSSNDERPDSLAAQAAAWVPPWERQQRPPDRAYQAAAEQAARDEAARDEVARDEVARDEVARDEAARDEAARDEAARDEAARDEAAAAELALIEADAAARVEAPEADWAEADLADAGTDRVHTDRVDAGRLDAGREHADSASTDPGRKSDKSEISDLEGGIDASDVGSHQAVAAGEGDLDAALAEGGAEEPAVVEVRSPRAAGSAPPRAAEAEELAVVEGAAASEEPSLSSALKPDKSEMHDGVESDARSSASGLTEAGSADGDDPDTAEAEAEADELADVNGPVEDQASSLPLPLETDKPEMSGGLGLSDGGSADERDLGPVLGAGVPADASLVGDGDVAEAFGGEAGGDGAQGVLPAEPVFDAGRGKAGAAVPEQGRRRRGGADAGGDGDVRTASVSLGVDSAVGGGELPGLSDEAEFAAALEAILLVVDEPVGEMQLAQILEQPTERVAVMLENISARYTAAGHGFDLRRAAGGWRLYTRPEYAAYVERFVLDGQSVRLTQAALETLAVVAYKQPVTRSRISAIRGVNCDGVMRTLVTRGLIEECGTESETGAYLYRTTALFLEKLGLNSVEQLPPLAPFLPDDVEEVLDAPG